MLMVEQELQVVYMVVIAQEQVVEDIQQQELVDGGAGGRRW